MSIQRIDILSATCQYTGMSKTSQLQIRIDANDKARIRQRAAVAGMDVSKWVLHKLLPPVEERFRQVCEDLAAVSAERTYVFAELNDFLNRLEPREFSLAVRYPPGCQLPPFEVNYLAAMIEYTAAEKKVPTPEWVEDIEPLEVPWFASSLQSLRLYLLTHSPPAFRRRNLFVDSSVGNRV